MSNKNANHYFLKGGGEMGELIRAKDWSKTSLGDPAGWPQSLQTMVALILDNPFGMYIAWGSQYIQLYNDGYRPILGANKHPQALGISTRETFSEIWDNIIGSMFDEVMKGKAVGYPDLMLPLNRNGFIEECYFDFSYSPIRKDDGEVGGVLVTVIETTEKKKAQAALIESTDQLKFAMDAAELGTWDYNPATDKFTANNRLKTWFGISESEEVALHHATDAIAEKDRERIIMAIKKSLDFSSGGIYDEEFTIINPVTQQEIIVHVQGRAWFNDEKIAYRFNGILQEVTENVLARKKIEDSEEQLRIAIEGGEFGTFDFLPQTNQLIWSDKTNELFGLPPGAATNYETYIAAIHPEDRSTSRAIVQQEVRLTEDGLYELEYRTIGITDGKLRWLRSKGKATYDIKGEPIRYTGVIQDITKQKEAAEILRENNKRFRDTVWQAPIGICILRGQQFMVEMANEAYLELVDRKEAEFISRPLFESLPEVEETVHQLLDDVLTTGIPFHGIEYPVPIKRFGKEEVSYFNFLYHPLKEDDGTISGVIVTVTDVNESVKAKHSLAESEKQFKNLIMQSPIALTILRGKEYIIEIANDVMINTLWKKSEAEVIGKKILEVFPELNDQKYPELLNAVSTEGITHRENESLTYIHNQYGELETFYLDFEYKPLFGTNGSISGIIAHVNDVTEKVEARNQIQESETRFRNMVEQAPVAMCVLRGENYVVEVANEKQLQVWRKTKEEVLNKPIFTAIPEGAGQGFEQLLASVFTTGKPFVANEFPSTLIRNGKEETSFLNFVYEPLYANDHKIDGVLSVATEVTEQVIARKQTEESKEVIQESKEQLEFILECAKGGYWDLDFLTGKGICSFRHDQCFGATEPIADWSYEKFLTYVYPEDLENVDNQFKEAVATGKDWTIECRILWKDGSIHWIQSSGRNYRYIEGKPTRMLGMVKEITEQKESQKKIEESEQRFRLSLSGSNQTVYSQDKNLKYTWIHNPHPNFKAEDIVGKTDEDLLDPSSAVFLTTIKQKILATGEAFNGDVEYKIAGQNANYSMHLEPIMDTGRNIIGIIGASVDITARKKAQQQIEESEQRFQAAIKAVQGILWTNNAKGEMEGEQPGWAALTGQTYEEYLGYGWAKKIHPDDVKPTLDSWNKAVKERNTFIFEHRLKTKNGEWRDFSIRAIPLLNADGTLLQWVGVHTDITDSKQAAKALKANEEKLTIVIEASELGTWEIDVKTNIVQGSRRLYEIMGYPQKNTLSLNDTLDRIHPDYVQLRAEAFKKAYKTGIFYFTGQIIWDDNSIHWIESKGKVFYDEQKNPVTIIGTTADITQEKQHQQEMEESEERFRNVANSAPVLIWMADTDKLCYFFNKGWLNFTGRTVEQERGNGWAEGVHPDDLQKCLDIYFSSFDKREPFYMEYRLKRYDGVYRWLSDSGVPRFTSDGVFEGYIGACMDINNERVHQQALEESEEKFRLLADSMAQHIWTSDLEGNLNYYNQSVFDYSGLTLQQINQDGWMQIVHPDDREENIKKWMDSITTGKDFLIEHRFRRHDGAYRWQLSRAIPQRDNNGKIQMWVGTSTDIQDQKTFATELERQVDERTKELGQKNNELEKMNKELESFAYISSHDLQEPLRKIQTFITRILEKEESNLSDNGKDMFNRMHKAAQRMQTLIQDLLAYSRTNTAKRKLETTDLNLIIAEIKDDLKEEIREKNATLEAYQLCAVDIIPFQFRQLMVNLISNSLKFSNPQNPPHIQIKCEIAKGIKFSHLKLPPQSKYCHITVSDNGIGFKQEYSEKIFEIFQRLHGREEYTGTGIGLSIVKKIVDNHNGIIVATGELNKGATFDIYIPTI